MKTIKRATGSKSGLLGKLALPFLLLIAVLGIEIGGGQTPPRERPSDGPDIGGQSAPRHYATTITEIGGSQTAPRDPASPIRPDIGGNSAPKSPVFATAEIGGQNQQVPKDTNPLGIGGSQIPPRQFAVSEPIGGNQNKPQVPDPLGIEIGGSQTAPRSYATAEPIGDTNGTDRRNIIKPYSPEAVATLGNETQFQRYSETTNPLGIPIGGNSCPRCGMASITIEIPPIGGGQTPPRPIDIGGQRVPGTPLPLAAETGEVHSVPDSNFIDTPIGGQIPPRTGGYLSSFLTDCTSDIGGNQGIPQSPLPIGGNGGGSTAPRNYRSII
ncbi:hypothetical protein [Flavobacterium sp.]|uniref:hypothetical protein n=1 Tax=Flavobacterium sp. TaxID=239 RepID=UPI0026145A56|nr:hypothetical protein [Flavobacterium sp.]